MKKFLVALFAVLLSCNLVQCMESKKGLDVLVEEVAKIKVAEASSYHKKDIEKIFERWAKEKQADYCVSAVKIGEENSKKCLDILHAELLATFNIFIFFKGDVVGRSGWKVVLESLNHISELIQRDPSFTWAALRFLNKIPVEKIKPNEDSTLGLYQKDFKNKLIELQELWGNISSEFCVKSDYIEENYRHYFNRKISASESFLNLLSNWGKEKCINTGHVEIGIKFAEQFKGCIEEQQQIVESYCNRVHKEENCKHKRYLNELNKINEQICKDPSFTWVMLHLYKNIKEINEKFAKKNGLAYLNANDPATDGDLVRLYKVILSLEEMYQQAQIEAQEYENLLSDFIVI